jgi:hypothetical protein
MESWRKVWRVGLAPNLSVAGLEALHAALMDNDDRLLQGASTSPPALDVLADADVEAACALCYAAWRGDGHNCIGDVAREFARVCQAADAALGEPAGVRVFLDWYDLTPRSEVRRLLREEVARALALHRVAAA